MTSARSRAEMTSAPRADSGVCGELSAADDEGRFLVGVVGGAHDGVGVGLVLLVVAAVADAVVAEQGEGDGVAAGFGEEVAAEAEHVGPAAQPGVRVVPVVLLWF